MNIFRTLFGGKETPEEKKKNEEKQFDVLKYDGVRALKSGQYAHAIACLCRALEMRPSDLECRDYLSQAYMSSGRLDDAYAQLSQLATACPDNVAVQLRMAELSYMTERYDIMAQACDAALRMEPNNAHALMLAARMHRAQGGTHEALYCVERLLVNDSSHGSAHLLRGELLLAAGRLDDAEAEARLLASTFADNEDVLLLVARIAAGKGLTEEAIKAYGRVLDANPFSVEAYGERAVMRRNGGDEAGAASDEAMARQLAGPMGEQEENIEQNVKNIYKNNDPYGVFSGN